MQQAWVVIFLGFTFAIGAVLGELVGPGIPVSVGVGIALVGMGTLLVGYYRRPK